MTIGSPVASAVSGPGVEDTKAMRLLSGDHEGDVLAPGRGAFVPSTSAISLAFVPSVREMTRPACAPTLPRYASHWPSGDQTGSPEASKRSDLPSARFMTHTWPYGRPAPSLFSTTYATCAPSGDRATPATDRNFSRSADWSLLFAGAIGAGFLVAIGRSSRLPHS